MAKAARTTITVPSDLKARMNAVTEPVNWSALACQAFEEKLAELAKKKVDLDRAEVIARLRMSKRKVSNRLFDSGFQAGGKWAKSEAEVRELVNLAKFRHDFTADGRRPLADFFDEDSYEETPGKRDKAGWAKAIACEAVGMDSDDYDDHMATKVAHEMFNNEIYVMNSPDYVHGFLEGALAVWDEVANEI